jgi:hypothetical protein
MSGAILPLPQYAFRAWCSVKAQGKLYSLLYFIYFRLSPGWMKLHNEELFINFNSGDKTKDDDMGWTCSM